MSEPPGTNPFEGMPFFGDLGRLFSAGGPVNWMIAGQLAQWVATEGTSEPNVDPVERMRLEELVRVADLQVRQATGLETVVGGRPVTVLPVTRGEWARRGLDAYKPMLERLATALAAGDEDEGTQPDPETELLGGLTQMLAPLLLGAQAGFMVGHLARRSLGQYDLPLPRLSSPELLVVPANLDEFAREWSLPPEDLRLWICLHEITHHAVLAVPHVRSRLDELLTEYMGGFRVDGSGLEEKLGSIDPTNPASFQDALGDPEALLGAIQTEEQRRLLPRIGALTAALEGYVDHVLDSLGSGLMSSYGMLSEALRRRRVEDTQGDRYVGHLFGIELGQAHYDRGAAFVRGIVERAEDEERARQWLARLWESERTLPTPPEVDAPGLWMARIELPTEEEGRPQPE